LVEITRYEVPNYAVLSSLLPFRPSWVHIIPSASSSEILLGYALCLVSDTKFHTHTQLEAKLYFRIL
jgi:hypothetical protein